MLTPSTDRATIMMMDEDENHRQENITTTPPRHSTRKQSKNQRAIDEMDEAMKEAHIVQKIELAIRKSRCERGMAHKNRSSSNSRTPSRSASRTSSQRGAGNTPSRSASRASSQRREGSTMDENYQMTSKELRQPSHIKRENFSRTKQHVHLNKTLPGTPTQHGKTKYRSKLLADMDQESNVAGNSDNKQGFMVLANENWLSATFSDPTLDTYEDKHFLGVNNNKHLSILDPQRIHCGPRSTKSGVDTATSCSQTGQTNAQVTSIIDRIYDKKEQTGNTYTRKAHLKGLQARQHQDNAVSKATSPPLPKRGIAEDKTPSELISFDKYEDDDGHYYEDDPDDYPIYTSSRPHNSSSAISNPFLSNMAAYNPSDDANATDMLQSQLNEINQLHTDIQRQQELIKQISARDAQQQKLQPRPHESSAEVYQRELARQAQAELYRLELVQKSMMLEKQMEIYRRNLEEWNKVRDLAIKEEEERRRMVEKAKKVWQAEMRAKMVTEESARLPQVPERFMSMLNGPSQLSSSSSSIDNKKDFLSKNPTNSTDASNVPSLYQKVAELNKRVETTEEDQKIIEAQILQELHMELSKRAAGKKGIRKPSFFSEKLQKSWSGKQSISSANASNVDELTADLARRIHELNLQMAPSKMQGHVRHRNKKEGNKQKRGITSRNILSPRKFKNNHDQIFLDSEELNDRKNNGGFHVEDVENDGPRHPTAQPVFRSRNRVKLKQRQKLSQFGENCAREGILDTRVVSNEERQMQEKASGSLSFKVKGETKLKKISLFKNVGKPTTKTDEEKQITMVKENNAASGQEDLHSIKTSSTSILTPKSSLFKTNNKNNEIKKSTPGDEALDITHDPAINSGGEFASDSSSKKKKPLLKKALERLKIKENKDKEIPLRGSAEIPISQQNSHSIKEQLPSPMAQYSTPHEPSPALAANDATPPTKSQDFLLHEVGSLIIGKPSTIQEEMSSDELMVDSPEHSVTSSGMRQAEDATSTQSTKIASNKVYIGVGDEAIEAMSFSLRYHGYASDPSLPSNFESDRPKKCFTSERNSYHATPRSKKSPSKQSAMKWDDPSIHEFMEVQYHHEDELIAPSMDELQADTRRRSAPLEP